MGYRIPDRPIDPPERRLTADDIEMLREEAYILEEKIYGALCLATNKPLSIILDEAHSEAVTVVSFLDRAREIVRQNEEGE